MPWVETNGIETYYEDYGNGPPLVVLHGATADHQVWAEQLQPLTDEYRVILYDLRGHGKTGGADGDRYTIETYVEDLRTLLTELGLDQPAVLGHSWGGMIGYVFATEYPDHISALMTVGSATPKMFSRRERLFKIEVSRVLIPLTGNEHIMNGTEWVLTKLFGDDGMADRGELERIREQHGCDPPELSVSERSKITQAVLDYWKSTPTWVFSETPVLVLYGENEPFIENHADFLEANIDTCETAEIPGASHNSQVDNPEFIRSKTQEFLATQTESVHD